MNMNQMKKRLKMVLKVKYIFFIFLGSEEYDDDFIEGEDK